MFLHQGVHLKEKQKPCERQRQLFGGCFPLYYRKTAPTKKGMICLFTLIESDYSI